MLAPRSWKHPSTAHVFPRYGSGVVLGTCGLFVLVEVACVPALDCAALATCLPEQDAAVADTSLAPGSAIADSAAFPSNDAVSDLAHSSDAGPFDAGARSDAQEPDQPVSVGAQPAPCPAALTSCGLSCVDSANDITNCGGCGVRCPVVGNAIAVCTNGRCASSCVNGFTLCGNTCVDLHTDSTHCGECGFRCQAPDAGFAMCSNGCVSTCPAARKLCAQTCVASDDVNHCGGCGHVCEPPSPPGSGAASCDNGKCEQSCNGSRLLCNGVCCASPPPNEHATCENGQCRHACTGATLRCGDGHNHCGSWSFESGQVERWAVYPRLESAWDRSPLDSRMAAGGRALAASFDGDGVGKAVLAFEVPLCDGGLAEIDGLSVRARIRLESAAGYPLKLGATGELWAGNQAAAPTPLVENDWVVVAGVLRGQATTLSVEVRIDQVWRGWVMLDDVVIE